VIRRALNGTALVASAVAASALASRYMPITNHAVLLTAALSPYLMLGAPLSAVLLILVRRWAFTLIAATLTVAVLAVQLPLYRSSAAAPAAGATLRVISANLFEGQADPGSIVRLARADADVLVVQELTSQEADRLSAAGLEATFPYRWLDARGEAAGVGVWSRLPLRNTKRVGGYRFALLSARIELAGVSVEPTVVAVHVPAPWPIEDWRRDLARLPATLVEVDDEAGGGSTIVAADLNSTTDMRPFRELLRNGYRDAVLQSGAGLAPTFPANRRLPPFVAVDHILTRNCTATSLRTVKLPGSDHRGLAATVTIPR
jgi:endonuclease/exonuclease/phosphatase (EEP) superfamily protein YafD